MKAALYARVSTDEQRKESIDDQLRECRELCRRHGFDSIDEFSDHARSGNEVNRPGYQKLLRSARRRKYDVVVAHELSRLWRSESEMHAVKEEVEYLDVHVVTDDGIDTRIVGMEILIAVKGAIAKQELRQIAHRTHRALKGLVLSGKSAGGKCYGYIAASKSASGGREINEAEAREVRRIFFWYSAAKSPRWIADKLNADRVCSPGSGWRKSARKREGKWLASTIYGDPRRGCGILNNEMYVGRCIWNRRRSRKKLKSGDREFLMRPKDEWVVTTHPEFRIVPQALWDKARERQRKQADHIGARVRRGLSMRRARVTGTYPKYLLSGLLQCGVCGSNLVVSGPRQGYVCASRANGGLNACGNKLRLPRKHLESRLLTWMKGVLSGSDVDRCLLRAWNARCAKRLSDRGASDLRSAVHAKELRNEISNIVDAIAQDGLKSSPALAKRLEYAELQLAAEDERDESAPARRKPPSKEFYSRFLASISERFEENARETRATLRDLAGGPIKIAPKNNSGEFIVSCALSRATVGFF
jgi:DNA invertase Pin-like site-specific DNA recombinase